MFKGTFWTQIMEIEANSSPKLGCLMEMQLLKWFTKNLVNAKYHLKNIFFNPFQLTYKEVPWSIFLWNKSFKVQDMFWKQIRIQFLQHQNKKITFSR